MKAGVQTLPMLGSRPDDSARTPGAIAPGSAIRVWPHVLGIKVGPQIDSTTFGTNVAPATPHGGALLADSGYNYKRYVGTATKLYEMGTDGTFTDRSRATSYGATQTNSWDFAQFGAISLAINKTDTLQQRTLNSTTAFADVSGAPKADVMFVCGPAASPFVMLLNFNDGTDTPDGWFASAISDYTGWTPGTNQSAKGQITDNNGPLTAGIAYRDGAVIFKEDGMWAGQYIGSPVIWSWTKISSDIGCIGKNAVCAVNDVIYFAGRDGLYMYDGSYPKKIPGSIHDAWATNFPVASFGFPNGSASLRGMHQVVSWPKYHLLGFTVYIDDGNRIWYWLNLRTGMWIEETRWGTDTCRLFIDPYCFLSGTSYHARSLTFETPASTTGSVVVGPFGADSPDLIHLRSAKPRYEKALAVNACSITAYAQNADLVQGILGDTTAQGTSPSTAVDAQAGSGFDNNWADFTDQKITANLIWLKLEWVLQSDFFGDVIFSGVMGDIAPAGSDHG